MDWEKAEQYLYEMKKAYEEIGLPGVFGLTFTIKPLVRRFESGERTPELYDEIMSLR